MKFTAMGKLNPIQVSLKHPLSDPKIPLMWLYYKNQYVTVYKRKCTLHHLWGRKQICGWQGLDGGQGDFIEAAGTRADRASSIWRRAATF